MGELDILIQNNTMWIKVNIEAYMSAYALQDLHLTDCFMYLPLFVGVQCWSLFRYA